MGLTFVKKIWKNTEMPPRLITQPGWEKQDEWTVGEKRIAQIGINKAAFIMYPTGGGGGGGGGRGF